MTSEIQTNLVELARENIRRIEELIEVRSWPLWQRLVLERSQASLRGLCVLLETLERRGVVCEL